MSIFGHDTLCADDAQAKQRAQAIKARMADLGHTIPLTHAYEALATAAGYRNWPTMKAALKGTSAVGPAEREPAIEAIVNGLINELLVSLEGDQNLVVEMTKYRPGKIELIVGAPGKGKSSLLDSLNIIEIQSRLRAGKALPEMLIVGPRGSHSDLIAAVEDALPLERKSEVAVIKARMDGGPKINPFDTYLGMREPTGRQKQALVTFLLSATGQNGESVLPDFWRPILHDMVGRLYELYSDKAAGGKPKQFIRTDDDRLNRAISKLGLPSEGRDGKTWWEIVDLLCSRGLFDLAELAQSYAVPNLADLLSLASGHERGGFAALGDMTQLSSNLGKNLASHHLVGERTTIDAIGSKVVLLDPYVMSTAGGGVSSFLLARLFVMRRVFLDIDECSGLSGPVLGYHESRIKAQTKHGVCVVYDEIERFYRPSLGEVLTRDALYVREIGGNLKLSSQTASVFKLLDVSIATDLYLLSKPNPGDIELLTAFGVEHRDYESTFAKLAGPGRTGLPIAVFSKVAKSSQPVVTLKMSPAALWATTASSRNSMLRSKLAGRVGISKAVGLLADRFPTQLVESYIEAIARGRAAATSEYSYRDLLGQVTNELIEELVALA